MGHILWVEPVFKEMIWGGNQLKEKYGYAIPSDQTGECWAPSAHPNGDNKIKEGEFKGQTLSKVFDEHRELFGNIKDKQFPLLVKIRSSMLVMIYLYKFIQMMNMQLFMKIH